MYTEVTIETEPFDGEPVRRVTTRELGGIVTIDDVRELSEGRVPDKTLNLGASNPIKFTPPEGGENSKVGDRVMVFLGGTPEDPGDYYSAARLTQSDSGEFVWPSATAPNEEWKQSLTMSSVRSIATAIR